MVIMNNDSSVTHVKRCSKCDGIKPLDAFGVNRKMSDGRYVWCRDCRSKCDRERYAADPKPKREKAATRYRENPERIAARRAANPEIYRERSRRNYELAMEDPAKREAYNEYHRRYRAEHRNRIREIQADHYERTKTKNPDQIERKRRTRRERERQAGWVTAKLKKAVYAHYGPSCYLCAGSANDTDHYQPLNAGGATELENLRPVCKGCNSRKSSV